MAMQFQVSLPAIFMNHFLVIPIVSTLAGVMISWLFRIMVIRNFPRWIRKLSNTLNADLLTAGDFSAPDGIQNNFHRVRPVIEGHIDEFLRFRLGKEMPMIGMFIGDKTITQLKAIFMKELDEIFPLIIGQYINGLSLDTHMVISPKISTLSGEKIKPLIEGLRMIPLWGAMAGLAIGILQLMVLCLVF